MQTMESLSPGRRKRLHRSSAAQFLASLESGCSADDLKKIDWSILDTVPHWCFSENLARDRLQLVCGTVFLAPLIAQWIDGGLLKQARALVGAPYFDAAMLVGSDRTLTKNVNASEPVPELLASAGASVLVYSVEHPVIRNLLADQFPMNVETIDTNIASSVYQLALDIVDRIQSQLAAAHNVQMNTEDSRASTDAAADVQEASSI